MKNVTIHRSPRTHYLDLLPIFRYFSSVFSLSLSLSPFFTRIVSFNLFFFAICINYVGTVRTKITISTIFTKFNASIRAECVETCSTHILLLSNWNRVDFIHLAFGQWFNVAKGKANRINKLNRICCGDVVQPPRKWMYIREQEEKRVLSLCVTTYRTTKKKQKKRRKWNAVDHFLPRIMHSN